MEVLKLSFNLVSNIKYLVINLTKDVCTLYIEMYETLYRDIKEILTE